ncbi:MAG: nickel pincer cofactor biosynthesis protein LarC [Thermoanaerobaculia bacterium]
MRGKDLHLDCFSGLAGDMFLGACLDLGMPAAVVAEAVASLKLHGISIEARKTTRAGFAGTRFRVLDHGEPIEGPDPEERVPESSTDAQAEKLSVNEDGGRSVGGAVGPAHPHTQPRTEHDPYAQSNARSPAADAGGADAGSRHQRDAEQPLYQQAFSVAAPLHSHGPGNDHGHDQEHGHGRNLPQILALLDASGLASPVKSRARALFHRLGEAEAKAHGMAVERVHFHEVGAVDSIVDLVGAAAAIEWLAPRRITCGAVNLGGGTARGAHGVMPVPPPAVAELMKGLPVYGSDRSAGELLTPTGAVLLAELVDEFTDLPAMVVEAVGYGLGRKEIAGRPNAVRLVSGTSWPASKEGVANREVLVVECEVDDLSGEGLGHAVARLLAEGALDVYLTPVQMKKGRPGSLVTMLCRRPDLERLSGTLLVETGSIGCRFQTTGRFEAEREIVTVQTRFGEVRVKRAKFLGRTVANAPEFEDCKRLAVAAGTSWRAVHEAATVAAAAGSFSL